MKSTKTAVSSGDILYGRVSAVLVQVQDSRSDSHGVSGKSHDMNMWFTRLARVHAPPVRHGHRLIGLITDPVAKVTGHGKQAKETKKVFWFIKPVKEMGGLTDGTERGLNIEH